MLRNPDTKCKLNKLKCYFVLITEFMLNKLQKFESGHKTSKMSSVGTLTRVLSVCGNP
jgi:hypothetical protein